MFFSVHIVSLQIYFLMLRKTEKEDTKERTSSIVSSSKKFSSFFSSPCCPLKLNYPTIQRRNTNYFPFSLLFFFFILFLSMLKGYSQKDTSTSQISTFIPSLLPLTLQTSFHSSLSFLTYLPPLSWYTWDPFQYFSSFSVFLSLLSSLTVQWFKCQFISFSLFLPFQLRFCFQSYHYHFKRIFRR